ncbi:MAG TPA: tetratricopeptide repeat protein [Aggregatilineales bacterium]|nr:tetratricopeptide repeat protein [Aggregatilineales bacterium]
MKTLRARLWYMIALMHRFYGLRTGKRHFFVRSDDAFSRALLYDPAMHAARFNRGILYWRELHAPARAVQDFTDVIAQTSIYTESLFLRGMAYQQMGDYHAAARDLEVYLAENPSSRWHRNASRQLSMIQAILEEITRQIPSETSDN